MQNIKQDFTIMEAFNARRYLSMKIPVYAILLFVNVHESPPEIL